MGKDHLKRMSLPASWNVDRKQRTYVTRPHPSGHSLAQSMAIGTVMKEVLDVARTNRECRMILHHKTVHLDGKRRKDLRTAMGLFDVLSFTDTKEQYRMILSQKGKLTVAPVNAKEASTKVCKVVGKSKVKGKTQIQLYDGRNILVDKDSYKVGDSITIEVPSQKIGEHFPLKKGASVLLTGGKHKGHQGTVEDVQGKKIMYKTHEGTISETLKSYAYVVGAKSPAMTITIK